MIRKLLSLQQITRLFDEHEYVVSGSQWLSHVEQYRRKVRSWKAQQSVVELEPLKVLLFCESSFEFAYRFFALGLEGIGAILPPNSQPETLNELAQQATAFAGTAPCPAQLSSLEHITPVEQPIAYEDQLWQWPDTTEVIFYTSGSSGKAKPIYKQWKHLVREITCLSNTFNQPKAEVCQSTVSHQHIYGILFKLLLPIGLGQCITSQGLYPEDLLSQAKNYQRIRLVCSPAFLQRLVQDNVLIALKDRITHIFSSGAPLPDDVAFLCYQQLGIGVTQIYGSSETGGIGYRKLHQQSEPWTPFDNMLLSQNEEGCLVLQSPYIHESNVALSDRVAIHSDGTFSLLGRADRIIKLEDKRLNLEEMEARLKEHEFVEHCRLHLLTGRREQLGAIVVLTPNGKQAREQQSPAQFAKTLRQHLQLHFELVCLPRKWRFVDELPYNSQGKLVAATLEKLFV